MKQVRFIPNNICGLHLREPQEGQEESRVVDGEPIIFGVRSVNLTPWSSTRKVYEVLEPGCITKELLQRSDVVFNINHSNKVTDVLGRYRNTDKDTLKLELNQRNVKSSCDLPKTNAANDTLELIKRGDISGMSFAFDDDYEDTENGVSFERTNEIEDGKEVWIRHVKRIIGLYDVSIVTHPAYEQTSVGTREASDRIDAAIEEQLKREAGQQETNEEREAREKEEREQQEREANGGETNAEKKAREQREQKEREQKEREMMAARRQREFRRRHMTEDMIESLSY